MGRLISFRPALNDLGQVALTAKLDNSDTSNDQGIWIGAPGSLQLLVREDDLVEVTPDDFRTVTLADLINSSGVNGRQSGFNASGQVAFVLRFTDGSRGVFLATAVGPNDPPIADAGPDDTVTEIQSVVLDGTASSDPEEKPLNFVWSIAGSQIATGPTPTVGPFAVGVYSITLTVTDASGVSDVDSKILTVESVPPIADAGSDQTVTSMDTVVLDGTASFDPGGTPLTYSWTISGSQVATGPMPTIGPFAVGVHSITLTVTDTAGDSDVDSMILTVESLPPVADAGPDQTVTDIDTVLLDGTGSSDPEATMLTYSWAIAGTEIATSPTPTVGPFTVGTHNIDLTVTDGHGKPATDSMILTVLPAPPVAVDDLLLLPKGRTVTGNLLANDQDIFGGGLTIVSVGAPSNGTATLNADDTVAYRRDSSFKSGCDQFGYTIEDARGTQASATAFVNVGNFSPCGPPQPNSPPVANDDGYTMTEGGSLTVAAPGVLDNDTDADGDPLTAALVSGPTTGALTLDPDGGFTFTPPVAFVGDASFTYRANDGTDDSNDATVVITVNPQGAGTVHVGDIDGASAPGSRGKWSATATVEVHDADPTHAPVANAEVFGSWQGANGATSCVTDASGRCSLTAPSVGKKKLSVTFTVDTH